ncbi:MAG: DNA (cytosine-5-)-methyltransferase [Lachnospiraceae bacterium]|nr:DNA (cytosine-5-)-methyltransferase [Lachnospiraceae bacterium]
MIKVLEAFSGIGAQAKALERLNIDYDIVATADWDINAIMAYDLIHNGGQDLSPYLGFTKKELVSALSKYTLSPDGKTPYKEGSLSRTNIEVLRRLLCAIERTNNLVSITDMTATDIPEDLDLFTYSFPCQDLSIAGVWHGNMSGIDRDANNRSGMLWEVERILKDCVEKKQRLPRFLLMENVSNIMAPRHMGNFQEWIDYLKKIGYYSKIYKLNASRFGIPQIRERVFMLSSFIGGDADKADLLERYFNDHNLENEEYAKSLPLKRKSVQDVIKNNYERLDYKSEACLSQLNDTPSRQRIIEENDKILKDGCYIDVLKTITTKQDRNPNSGVIEYINPCEGKANWRYLTARECFLAMGFDECDYEILMDNNFDVAKNKRLFSESKLIKMAGNSIVVNVLEAIFMQVIDIKELLNCEG